MMPYDFGVRLGALAVGLLMWACTPGPTEVVEAEDAGLDPARVDGGPPPAGCEFSEAVDLRPFAGPRGDVVLPLAELDRPRKWRNDAFGQPTGAQYFFLPSPNGGAFRVYATRDDAPQDAQGGEGASRAYASVFASADCAGAGAFSSLFDATRHFDLTRAVAVPLHGFLFVGVEADPVAEAALGPPTLHVERIDSAQEGEPCRTFYDEPPCAVGLICAGEDRIGVGTCRHLAPEAIDAVATREAGTDTFDVRIAMPVLGPVSPRIRRPGMDVNEFGASPLPQEGELTGFRWDARFTLAVPGYDTEAASIEFSVGWGIHSQTVDVPIRTSNRSDGAGPCTAREARAIPPCAGEEVCLSKGLTPFCGPAPVICEGLREIPVEFEESVDPEQSGQLGAPGPAYFYTARIANPELVAGCLDVLDAGHPRPAYRFVAPRAGTYHFAAAGLSVGDNGETASFPLVVNRVQGCDPRDLAAAPVCTDSFLSGAGTYLPAGAAVWFLPAERSGLPPPTELDLAAMRVPESEVDPETVTVTWDRPVRQVTASEPTHSAAIAVLALQGEDGEWYFNASSIFDLADLIGQAQQAVVTWSDPPEPGSVVPTGETWALVPTDFKPVQAIVVTGLVAGGRMTGYAVRPVEIVDNGPTADLDGYMEVAPTLERDVSGLWGTLQFAVRPGLELRAIVVTDPDAAVGEPTRLGGLALPRDTVSECGVVDGVRVGLGPGDGPRDVEIWIREGRIFHGPVTPTPRARAALGEACVAEDECEQGALCVDGRCAPVVPLRLDRILGGTDDARHAIAVRARIFSTVPDSVEIRGRQSGRQWWFSTDANGWQPSFAGPGAAEGDLGFAWLPPGLDRAALFTPESAVDMEGVAFDRLGYQTGRVPVRIDVPAPIRAEGDPCFGEPFDFCDGEAVCSDAADGALDGSRTCGLGSAFKVEISRPAVADGRLAILGEATGEVPGSMTVSYTEGGEVRKLDCRLDTTLLSPGRSFLVGQCGDSWNGSLAGLLVARVAEVRFQTLGGAAVTQPVRLPAQPSPLVEGEACATALSMCAEGLSCLATDDPRRGFCFPKDAGCGP